MSVACIFPGQGSQSVGMLAEMADAYPIITDTYATASEVLGYDLWALVKDGPSDKLNQTEHTQPAMLAAGVSVWRCWLEQGGSQPKYMAGHSLGEYTALVCAGSMEFEVAVALVSSRAKFMQEAVPVGEGAMAAILGMDDTQVQTLCDTFAEGMVLAPVNYNAPGQVVIAGAAVAVERAINGAKGMGAKRALALPVSVPSHCDLMRPAAEKLLIELNKVQIEKPNIPVLHNVDVSPHDSAESIAEVLAAQLYKPVRWVETIRMLHGNGIETLVECGPGKVLAGLNRRIEKTMTVNAVYDQASLQNAL